MELRVESGIFRIAQLGPQFMILRPPVDLPPCDGEVTIQIDGNTTRFPVRLEQGSSVLQSVSLLGFRHNFCRLIDPNLGQNSATAVMPWKLCNSKTRPAEKPFFNSAMAVACVAFPRLHRRGRIEALPGVYAADWQRVVSTDS